MDEVRIESTREGAVRVITLARPEKRNALSMDMFAVLTEAFEQEPPPVERLTLLRAEGPVFCAGVDLGQRAERAVAEGESPLERLCAAISAHPLPVVAAVQGAAIGGGLMMALHCDFVVAVKEAKIGNSAVQLGIVPPWPLTRKVAEVAGPSLARELLVRGDLVPAERLAAAHVITAAVSVESFDAEIERIVGRLALNAPLSLRAIKSTLVKEAFAAVPHKDVERLIQSVQESEDAKEGVSARREKRPPVFMGR
jgi:enoyl-CoA hydratase/carnithine racemase